jgi:hypothetical protein
MLGHLVSNAFPEHPFRRPRGTPGLLRRLWAYFFKR